MSVPATDHSQTAAVENRMTVLRVPSGSLYEVAVCFIRPAELRRRLGCERVEYCPAVQSHQPERLFLECARLVFEVTAAEQDRRRGQTIPEGTVVFPR